MKSSSEPPPLISRLTTLSDLARLRILRLLSRQELSVGELAKALQTPQSTVSRHLKLLHDGGWITKRSEGTASLYRLVEESLQPEAKELWRLARNQMGTTHTFEEDDARLVEVLAERREDSKTFFGRVGSEWDHLRRDLFGDQFTTEALLGLVTSEWVVADVGCGSGNAAEFLAPFVKKVIAIDREPAMLDAARQRLAEYDNIEFRGGDMANLPVADGELDAAAVYLVMHHLKDPQSAVLEIARALKPGGRLLIVDMVAHDRESYRHTMGHEHLGFEMAEIEAWAAAADLQLLHDRRLRPATDAKGPGLFVATMRKPG
ncbi:MAG: metalloregulator ArsR/SmtB family transcription factor [Phycisphaerales bacterium]|nr:MAG: metalloregulator ArsR/SmtB family transcription factor [Phycisphaerales bacterium]